MYYTATPYHVDTKHGSNITILDKFYKPVERPEDIEMFVEQANFFSKMKEALDEFFNDEEVDRYRDKPAFKKLYDAFENYC